MIHYAVKSYTTNEDDRTPLVALCGVLHHFSAASGTLFDWHPKVHVTAFPGAAADARCDECVLLYFQELAEEHD